MVVRCLGLHDRHLFLFKGFFFMRELLFWTVLEMLLGLLFIGGDRTLAGERGRRQIILLWGWKNGRNRGWDWRIFACFFLGGGMWSFIKMFFLTFWRRLIIGGGDFIHWLVLSFLILQILFKTEIFSLFALPGSSVLYSVCIGFTCHSFVHTGDLVRRDIAACGYFVNNLPFSVLSLVSGNIRCVVTLYQGDYLDQ